jgi:ABC-2 type transport system permease protein
MLALIKRELKLFFITPVAYIFTAIFIMTSMSLTFYFGNFFGSGVADLTTFFSFLPWVFIFFIPAVTMKSWSEEKRLGTIELLMTLPVALWKVVLSKFIATWVFVIFSIILTFPIWITVNYLGDPDNLIIFGQYLGVIIMAGSYISLGIFFSSLTNNQIISFIISIVVSFVFTISGFPLMINFISQVFPLELVELISSFSFLTHFSSIQTGFFSFKGLMFFLSFMALWNYLTLIKFMNRE